MTPGAPYGMHAGKVCGALYSPIASNFLISADEFDKIKAKSYNWKLPFC